MTATPWTLPSVDVIDPKLAQAVETFHRAADEVAAVLRSNTDWGASGLRDGQYAVDLDADAACLDALYTAGYRVLSEESGVTGPPGSDTAPIVVVDPLDGSTNASRRVPWYASALCLVDDDGPAAALVVNHATGERFSAVRGGGRAERDGLTISTSGQTDLAASILGVSGLPTHHYGWAQFRALGASAPDICAVACGVTDAWCDMIDDGHGVWDYLASVLILEEAGGVATEVFGRDLCVLDHHARRSPVVAATPELLEQVLAERRPTAN
jgi:fructose-1,6-bisphosphatase/inositol monophosphatase family enzyme